MPGARLQVARTVRTGREPPEHTRREPRSPPTIGGLICACCGLPGGERRVRRRGNAEGQSTNCARRVRASLLQISWVLRVRLLCHAGSRFRFPTRGGVAKSPRDSVTPGGTG